MRVPGISGKLGLVIGTMVLFGVLILSYPAFSADPLSEITVDSWIYSGIARLADFDLVSSKLLFPRAGQPLLRFEGAMLIHEVLQDLLRTQGREEEELAEMVESTTIRSAVSSVIEGYRQATGNSVGSDAEVILGLLSEEFLVELQILVMDSAPEQSDSSSILEEQPVTIRIGDSDGVQFVDVDALAPEKESQESFRPPVRLLTLAAQYFQEHIRLKAGPEPLLVPAQIELGGRPIIIQPSLTLTGASQQEADYATDSGLVGWRKLNPTWHYYVDLAEDSNPLYVLDSESTVFTGLTLGTLWVADQQLVGQQSRESDTGQLTKTLSGKYEVWPQLTIIGEYAQSQETNSAETYTDAAAQSLGAVVKLGELELGAKVQSVGPSFEPLLETPDLIPNTSGLGLSVRYKNLTVGTLYDKIKATESASEKSSTKIHLNYSFADRAMLKAGYSFVDVDSVETTSKEASLGVDLTLDSRTKVEAGVTFGWLSDDGESSPVFDTKMASAGLEWRLPWEMDLHLEAGYQKSDGAEEVSTKIGLGYNFLDNASLLLGYQLINFSSTTPDDGETDASDKGRASAELNITF